MCLLYSTLLSVQSLSRVWLFATPWTAADQASLSIINSRSLLKLMSIESVMPSNHRILCHPLLLLSSTFPSIRVFSNELALLIRWPKYWCFSISPSNEYSGLISFKTDWFDLSAQVRMEWLKAYVVFSVLIESNILQFYSQRNGHLQAKWKGKWNGRKIYISYI